MTLVSLGSCFVCVGCAAVLCDEVVVRDLLWCFVGLMEGIGLVWSIALETGANVLALTVTEAAVRDGSLMRRRDALNALIAEHEADRLCVPRRIYSLSDPQDLELIEFS